MLFIFRRGWLPTIHFTRETNLTCATSAKNRLPIRAALCSICGNSTTKSSQGEHISGALNVPRSGTPPQNCSSTWQCTTRTKLPPPPSPAQFVPCVSHPNPLWMFTPEFIRKSKTSISNNQDLNLLFGNLSLLRQHRTSSYWALPLGIPSGYQKMRLKSRLVAWFGVWKERTDVSAYSILLPSPF